MTDSEIDRIVSVWGSFESCTAIVIRQMPDEEDFVDGLLEALLDKARAVFPARIDAEPVVPLVIVVPDGADVQFWNDDNMRAAGWVRAR